MADKLLRMNCRDRLPAGRETNQARFSMNMNTSSMLHRFTWAALAPILIALKRMVISAALRWPMRAERVETVMILLVVEALASDALTVAPSVRPRTRTAGQFT